MGLFIYWKILICPNTDIPGTFQLWHCHRERVRVGVSGREESNQNFAIGDRCSLQGCMKCTCSFGENWKQGI